LKAALTDNKKVVIQFDFGRIRGSNPKGVPWNWKEEDDRVLGAIRFRSLVLLDLEKRSEKIFASGDHKIG